MEIYSMLDYNTIFFAECQDRNGFLFHFVNFAQTWVIFYSRLTSKNIPLYMCSCIQSRSLRRKLCSISQLITSCFLIIRSTVSRALLQYTDHSHCFSTSFSLFKSSGLAICSFMPVFFASCTSSAKAFAVMAMMGTLPRLPASARIAAVAS